ncbi:hypothetical protein M0R72_13050 [Candidatus Pacearchaeota archaeon]|jgi:hypothetical protein|nr:hypothetical protein [Candidatus Pacearchaeota archaeon]
MIKTRRRYDPAIGDYFDSSGEDSLDITINGAKYATIQAAMNAAVANDLILVGPGTYTEDVTWSDASGVALLPRIPDTVVIEAVTAFAVKIDPAAASATWSATLGVNLSHGDGLVGLQINNTSVGKRMNIYLRDVDIESETSADHAIDVNRSGSASDAIRLYATSGNQSTIEGLVDYITESTDDRVRFDNYRLIGGLTVTGAVVMEITLTKCGILTSGLTVNASNVYNLIACWYETDANPNVHTACVDAVEQ